MKILMITSEYPLKEVDEISSKTLYNFVQSWICQGHEVDVIRPNFVLWDLLRGKKIDKKGWYNNVYNVNYWTPFLFNVKNKLKDFDFDKYNKIFAHMPEGEVFALHLGVDYVAGVHEQDFEVLTNPLCKYYFKQELLKAHKKAVGIACKSRVLRTRFIKEFPMYMHKSFVALSGVDGENSILKEFRQKPRYMDGIKSDYKRVLVYSKYASKDSIKKYIDACNNVEGIQLTVISDTEQRQKLKTMSSNVVFLDKISQDRLFERMRVSDIFIFPFECEIQTQTYLEAMMCGCVPVCLKTDAISDVIEDGNNGFVCELDDLEAILSQIVKQEDLKMISKNAIETAKKYTNETCAKDYLDNVEHVTK